MLRISDRAGRLPLSAALSIDTEQARMAEQGRSVIRLCVGEPCFKTPDAALMEAKRAIEAGETKYTHAAGSKDLRSAIADKLKEKYGLTYGLPEIAVTTGAKYAVFAALCAVTDPGDDVLLPAPYWTSYAEAIRLAGAQPVIIRTDLDSGWKLKPDMVRRACGDRTRAIVMNNPNNPTGAVYSSAELKALAETFREHDLCVIADEIYDSYVFTDESFTCMAALDRDMKERTVLINGVSKAYAMTGWRIGYIAADKRLVSAVSALLSHTTGCPNTVAQAAAAAALRHADKDSRAMCRAFRSCRDILMRGLAGLEGIKYCEPEGAFYLTACLDGSLLEKYGDGTRFAEALLRETGVALVPCADYGEPAAVRITFSVPEADIKEGVKRIAGFIRNGKRGA